MPIYNIALRMAVLIAPLLVAQAADVTGTWRAEIDTQIGVQKYVYQLQAKGAAVTGKAEVELDGTKREAELKEGRIAGDRISFVEMFRFQDNEIRIDYQGKVDGDEIKFTRKVGDFATEDFVAHRVKAVAQTQRPSQNRPPVARLAFAR